MGWVPNLGRYGPGVAACVPRARDSGGQYWVVVHGVMKLNAVSYPKLSCLFVTADEVPMVVNASEEGMEMLVLQFPEKNCTGKSVEC